MTTLLLPLVSLVQAGTATAQGTTPVAVAVSISTSPVAAGEQVRVSAVVTGQGSSATPTGSAQFSVDGSPKGGPVPLVGGTAVLTAADLPVGAHSVTASYSGGGGFAAGDAGPGGRVVVVPGGTSQFHPLAPARLLDTRGGGQAGYTGAKPAAGGLVEVQVTGRGGVPAEGVTAVVVNVTVTEAAGPGYVTAYPSDGVRPLASNLNPEFAGQTIPNLVVVPVSAAGRVSLYTRESAHLLADVAGYFTPAVSAAAGRLVPVTPARLLDTRSDGPQTGYTGARPAAGATVGLQVTGRGGVPAEGVAAVALNVTATNTGAAGGYVTVHPQGGVRPVASNLNVSRVGQTIPNAVWVPVSSLGRVDLFTMLPTDLVVDVVGWFTTDRASHETSGLFVPTAPSRVLDTRPDGPQRGYSGPRPGPGAVVDAGGAPIPSANASAVVVNVTAVQADPGFVSAYPAGRPRPLASSLNLDAAGQTRPNLVTSPVGDGNAVSLYTQSGTHLVADVEGWFTADLDPAPQPTERVSAEPAADTTTIPPDGVTAVTGDPTNGYAVRLPAGSTPPPAGNGIVLQGGGSAYPQGLTGRVTAVAAGPGGTTDLTVAPAALDEVFRELDVVYDGPADLAPAGTTGRAAANDVGGVETGIENSLIDFGAGAFDCDVSAGVTVSASLVRFENTTVHFEQRTGFGVTPFLQFHVRTEPVVRFSGDVHGKVTCELSAAFRNTHRLVWVLPTQVPITVDLAPALRFEASAAGKISFTQRFHRMVGFSTNPDLSIRTYNAGSQTTEEASVGAELSASLLIGADASVKLFDVAGAGITLGPEFTASVDTARCVELSVAITADFDLRINLWVKQLKYTVATVFLGPWTLFRRCPGGGTQPLSVVTGTLGPFKTGQAANARLQASGGVSPYTWQAANLPPGLALSAQGVLSGTPTAGGVTTSTITVRDQRGTTVPKDFRITVDSAVVLGPTTWQTAYARLLYVQYLDVQPYCSDRGMTYRATGLPAGLSVVGGYALMSLAVSGVTDAVGTHAVTVSVTCDGRTTELRANLVVAVAPDPGADGLPGFGMSVGSDGGADWDPGYTDPWVAAVRPSPDNRYLAAALGTEDTIGVYDRTAQRMIPLTRGLGDAGGDPAWSPDSRYLAFTSRENPDAAKPGDPDGNFGGSDLFLWDSLGGTTRRITDSPPGTYGTDSDTPSWSPDGTLLAFNSRDRDNGIDRVRTWSPATGQFADLPCGSTGGCRVAASSTPGSTEPWSADSRHLATLEQNPQYRDQATGLRVWDRAGGSRLLSTGNTYFGARLTQDGRKALVERVQDYVRTTFLVDVATGATLTTYSGELHVNVQSRTAPGVFSASGGHFLLWACVRTPVSTCGPVIVDATTAVVDTSLLGFTSTVGWVGDAAVLLSDQNGFCYTAATPGAGRRDLGCPGASSVVGSDRTGFYLSRGTATRTVGIRRITVSA